MGSPIPTTLLWSTLAACGISFTMASGCRTPQRAITTDGLPTKMVVTLSGLDRADASKKEWIYELAGCITPLNGNLEDDNKVVFSTIGLKRGLGRCELRIKVASPTTGFTFIGPEEGVLYIAKDITIAQDYDGSLAAEADLQKLYGVTISKETRFVLRIPVLFPNDETSDLVTAALDGCEPNFTTSSTFKKSSERSGTLELLASIPTKVSIQCKTLRMDVNGISLRYTSSPTESFKFTADPGSSAELPSVTLVATSKPNGDGKGVSVKTSPAAKQCDPAKEIFDTATRSCKPKP
jgi:hypothetical protein